MRDGRKRVRGMRMWEDTAVEVAGGRLAVRRWPGRPGAGVVLAAHGISGNGLSWALVAEALGDVEVIAPDLRGRGHSRDVPGPYSMAQHAEDLVAVLDHFGIGRAVLAGHSMGGYAACVAGRRDPRRYSELVLIDGGLGFPVPKRADIGAVLHAVIGPAMDRLEMEFADRAAYHRFWAGHPAFARLGGPVLADYLERDLTGEEPHLRSACRAAAVREDAEDELRNPGVFAAIHELALPATFLWAERGLRNEPVGLYAPEVIATSGLAEAGVDVRFVPDENHYSLLLAESGARVVAGHLLTAARREP